MTHFSLTEKRKRRKEGGKKERRERKREKGKKEGRKERKKGGKKGNVNVFLGPPPHQTTTI